MSTVGRPLATGFCYPEGPRWRDGLLWFSDQHDGHVYALDAQGRVVERFAVPGRPSGLGWLPGGDLLVVSMEHRCLYRRENDALHPYADLRGVHPADSNDMVVDASGRAWVGNIGFDYFGGESVRSTCIARVDPDGRVAAVAHDLYCPNGTVIGADGESLIVAETFAMRLTAFAIAADGSLSQRRIWADLDGRSADGICLDAEGHVWAAIPLSQAVLRIAPGGAIVDQVQVEHANPYACALGGADGRTLHICCAPDHDAAVTRERRGGRIDTARVAVPGAGSP